jgi:glycosyltransferase involved in cell wall biosynthesis
VRLLVVSNLYPPVAEGGYEIVCADTVAGLSGRHDILVLTSSQNRDAVGEERGVRRALPYLRPRRWDSLLASLTAWQGARAMRSALADWKPDLIFVWNASAIPHSALWRAQRSGVPIAVYVAAPWLSGLYARDRFARHLVERGQGLRRAWGGLMKLANLAPGLQLRPGTPFHASVCWVSEATRRQSPPPPFMQVDVARVINPATRRYARFAAASRRPADGVPLIAFVGRLEHEKGPDVALRALAHLTRELGVAARLELAGPGDTGFRRGLERLASDLGVADRVHFRGPLPLDGVVDLFERAHLLVVPSVWEEPMATVCIEAAFAQIPVVASLSGGMPEALRPDSEALYFPIGDWRACAEAFAATLAGPESTGQRVERARQRAESFSFERFMIKIAEFVEAAATSDRHQDAA